MTSHIAILVLTDEALEEARHFFHISQHTSGLNPEFDPIHRLAVGAVLSIEGRTSINIRSTKELEQEGVGDV